jgi:hypothetical protein
MRRPRGGRPDRFAGPTALEQRLSLHLLEIRVSGLLLDEAVDQRQRLCEPSAAVGEHGAGIAGGRRGVVAGIAAKHGVGAGGKAVDLRPHQIVARLQGGRILGL